MRQAVVVLNMGGPDGLDAVEPFLFNLFNDPAIINVPQPLRWFLARRISKRRAPTAREIYAHLGGRSPLVAETRAQAEALETKLGSGFRVFVAMRYWHPLSEETVDEVKAYRPDGVTLLPLYPQYSSTTSWSSLIAWKHAARRAGLNVPTTEICCYPTEPGWIDALTDLTRQGLAQASAFGPCRLLFTAHGLPKKIVDRGDPYQRQVEATVAAVVTALARPELDWSLGYQSRVGRMEWIGPSTESEIQRAGKENLGLVVVPVAFVSEHSETLVELDIEYRAVAEKSGVPCYIRVPTVRTKPTFINALAGLVRSSLSIDEKTTID
ncbi:MAG: ferrochelatase [Alphaproteobacteria bacterium]|nr:ferrochelatase [Alphaproteobacteria bacterium]